MNAPTTITPDPVRTFRTCDPFVRFRVTLASGEAVAVWARTQRHAEEFASEVIENA